MRNKIKLYLVVFALSVNQFVSAQLNHGRLPAYKTIAESALAKSANKPFSQLNKTGIVMPANTRYPGEFEESQVVLISWSDLYNDITFEYEGADTITEWGFVSAQLANYIQQEVPVWIRVYEAKDTVTVKAFMQNLGTPLVNYKFIVSMGNAWWMRDFAPSGMYYGTQDSLLLVDIKYYDGREYDDTFSLKVAEELNLPLYSSALYGEGGNLMTDGFGRTFFSTVITNTNASAWAHNPVWSKAQTLDTMRNLFAIDSVAELGELFCDGGTGHIDLYTKMIDEQTIMVVKYPDVITAGDKKRVEDAYQYMTTMVSPYNRPYRIYRVEHPTDDAGVYSRKTCNQMNQDARTFVNGLTINKTFIYPSYSNDTSGNEQQTEKMTEFFKSIMPGYKVVDIDSRALSVAGGEIHCITMQIPAENPVHFWHPSVDGLQPLQTSYRIFAQITNRSGISSAVCKWRVKGTNTWQTLPLTDSSNYYVGNLVPGNISVDDIIEYYLEAETNNGKTAVKPITAPDGYYRIYFKTPPTSLNDIEVRPKDYLFGAHPNPATNQLTINFYAMEVNQAEISIYDITGKKCFTEKTNARNGLNSVSLNVADWESGMYFYSYHLNGQLISTRKLIVK
jgi:agmatine/peptidylarginine deiminase